MAKLAFLGLAGTTIEWYDFFLFGSVRRSSSRRCSSPDFRICRAVRSFSTFAIGFLARPVGALVFGHLGDRVGRKSALAVALVLMAQRPR